MKTKLSLVALLFVLTASSLQAQHVKVRLNFPVGIHIGAPGPSPFNGAIWIGPEWKWYGGQYVHVPGYWFKPQRHKTVWVTGRWKYSRRGYRWVPGHWKG